MLVKQEIACAKQKSPLDGGCLPKLRLSTEEFPSSALRAQNYKFSERSFPFFVPIFRSLCSFPVLVPCVGSLRSFSLFAAFVRSLHVRQALKTRRPHAIHAPPSLFAYSSSILSSYCPSASVTSVIVPRPPF